MSDVQAHAVTQGQLLELKWLKHGQQLLTVFLKVTETWLWQDSGGPYDKQVDLLYLSSASGAI